MLHRPRGGRIAIAATVTAVFQSHVQHDERAPEAGGILLGRVLLYDDDVVIDEATTPGAADKRSRFSFIRARAPAQAAIDASWRTSEGTIVYLGEWHTHPEDDPTPSSIDMFNWRRIVLSDRFETEFLLFAIVGRRVTRLWEAWRAFRGVALEPIRE